MQKSGAGMVDLNDVIKENKGSVQVDLACFKEKISLVDLHALVERISKIKDSVNIEFENVEKSGIGDDAKWILYCISLLKDNIGPLEEPKSKFSISPADLTQYGEFINGFGELIQSTITITKLGERNQKDKQDSLKDIVKALECLKKHFSKDDEGNIVYESRVALAKVTLPGVENTEIEAYKKTLEKQNEKIKSEVEKKIDKLVDEIIKLTRFYKVTDSQKEKKSKFIDEAYKKLFDAAKCIDAGQFGGLMIEQIKEFSPGELKELLKQAEMLKQANKNELPVYLANVIEVIDKRLRKINIRVQGVFSQSPYHTSLFRLLLSKKVTPLEQRLFILDLMSCAGDDFKQKKLVELAKEHCKSIIKAVDSKKDSILSEFFEKVPQYLKRTSPNAIGLLRTIEVLSEIKDLLDPEKNKAFDAEKKSQHQEKNKAFDDEKTSQTQERKREDEEALVAVIKTWPDNGDWPGDKMLSGMRSTFFKSVSQIGPMKKTWRNKRQKIVDELIRPKSSEFYVPKVLTDGFRNFTSFFSHKKQSQDPCPVATATAVIGASNISLLPSTVTPIVPNTIEGNHTMPMDEVVAIPVNGGGHLYIPSKSVYGIAKINVPLYEVVPDAGVHGLNILPQNVPPYPVATVTSGGKPVTTSMASLVPLDSNEVKRNEFGM